MTLKKKIIQASAWTLGGHATSQAIRLLSNLILTRMLMPEAFGVMAIANSFILGLTLFSDMGLGQSIIQHQDGNKQKFINTAWTIQIVRGLVIWLLALSTAAVLYLAQELNMFRIDNTYSQAILPWILATLGFSAIISGFESTKLALANRNLQIKKIATIELASQIGALLLMLIWSFLAPSIWALVVGAVVAATVRTTLSHTYLLGDRNLVAWDKQSAKEIFGYGKWIFFTSIIGFLSNNADKFLLAGLVNSTQMGLYAIAAYLLGSIQQIYTKIFSNVAFPVFCDTARVDPQNLKNIYYKFRLPADIASLTMAGVLLSSGSLIVNALYDTRYQGAGRILEILSIALFEIRFNLAGHCFMAIGKPNLLSPIISVRLFIICVITPPIYYAYGFDGALWIVGGSTLSTIPMTIYLKYKNNLLDIKKEIMVLPIFIISYIFGLLANWFTMKFINF
jgi:O-antigen/teichoic acid export membrane protein